MICRWAAGRMMTALDEENYPRVWVAWEGRGGLSAWSKGYRYTRVRGVL